MQLCIHVFLVSPLSPFRLSVTSVFASPVYRRSLARLVFIHPPSHTYILLHIQEYTLRFFLLLLTHVDVYLYNLQHMVYAVLICEHNHAPDVRRGCHDPRASMLLRIFFLSSTNPTLGLTPASWIYLRSGQVVSGSTELRALLQSSL